MQKNMEYKNLINLIKTINDRMGSELENISSENFSRILSREENELSELFMHKILFFIYGGFYKNFEKELFKPNFEAWKYGPVEKDYRKQRKSKKPNYEKFDLDSLKLNEEEKKYLYRTISNLLKNSPWNLVSISHDTKAWKKNYNSSKRNKILKEDIFESFKDIII